MSDLPYTKINAMVFNENKRPGQRQNKRNVFHEVRVTFHT